MDAAVSTCAHDPILRQAFLKFITEPLTDAGTDEFNALMRKRANKSSDFLKGIVNAKENLAVSTLQQRSMSSYMHQNFWGMPFELRTVDLDRLLFPVDSDTNDKDAFNQAVGFVYDKVLPLERKFAQEVREVLTVYLDCCPPELRRTTFSAILATTAHNARFGVMRPGQVISYTLTRTGAAGGMLLQAGHSYLSGLKLEDPDLIQLRDDLKGSKMDFSPPQRWEVFERMAVSSYRLN